MATAAKQASGGTRLSWLDSMKGLSILWIAFFHFFGTYANGRFPSALDRQYFSPFLQQCAPTSTLETLGCVAQGLYVAVSSVGFHAVAVFLILSGFGLTFSLARTGEPDGGWRGWYRGRLLRLFPMYWLAHLIYLVSPFILRPEPVDYRFFLSLLGDRVWPVDTIFYYINPAWWYFGLLVELYLVFPLLFRLLQKMGPTGFLIFCGAATLLSRYLLLMVLGAHGYYVQGAFFGARLWEFAAGMVLGWFYRRNQAAAQEWLFTGRTFFTGVLIYVLGLYSYNSTVLYIFTDALIGTGLFIILAHVSIWADLLPRLGRMFAYVGAFSYGLYLLHQPYVIYFGERVRDLNLLTVSLVGWGIIAGLTVCAIPLERYVNQLTSRVLDRKKDGAQLAAVSQKQATAGG
ncbi:MAG: acyltransferase [Deltaproteobacteria bacterium]|nr:acyltransferase [Deltaproteobacteria bacterium]